MDTRILNIGPGSDGDGRKWPKHTLTRNDAYYFDKVGAEWIKDMPGGPQPGVTYRIDRLPHGYAGFEKARPDSKHVDRYIYGHPNGQFRSIVEFYPHFKHLMDVGGSAGCTCVKCVGGNSKKPKDRPERQSKYFAQAAQTAQSDSEATAPAENLISPLKPTGTFKKGRWPSEEDQPVKRKDIDFEGTHDVYERLIKRLKDSGPDASIDEPLEETMSPDWRAVRSQMTESFSSLRSLPRYVPRVGELVMFVRKFHESGTLAWDNGTSTFRLVDRQSNTWRGLPGWEAGVITQMPQEEIAERDLVTDSDKQQSILYSGFRVEPMSQPGSESKPYTRQYKQVPLHAIRPFAYWRDCLRGTAEKDWHPTVKHALTVASSVCVVGRYKVRGMWPTASIFCRGMYLGPELVMLGDAVRLLPRAGEQSSKTVTEAMVITAIRLRFVNLDFDEDDLAPTAPELTYQTSLHVSGRVFTTDPSRSHNGVSKKPIDPKAADLPSGMEGYGPWYSYCDPGKSTSRVEIPFSRILGRCYEHPATKVWFTQPANMKTEMQPPAFKAVNASNGTTEAPDLKVPSLSRGLTAIRNARKYSQEQDARLTSTAQPWFWADTRIEQLDLHEVNGRFEGAKDPMRTKDQLSRWHKALKGLDGKKGGLEEYHAARKERIEQENAVLQSKGGMMASAAVDTDVESEELRAGLQAAKQLSNLGIASRDSLEGADEEDEGDAMDVDDFVDAPESATAAASLPAQQPSAPKVTIDLSMDSESEDEMAQNQLVGELFKNVRPGGSR